MRPIVRLLAAATVTTGTVYVGWRRHAARRRVSVKVWHRWWIAERAVTADAAGGGPAPVHASSHTEATPVGLFPSFGGAADSLDDDRPDAAVTSHPHIPSQKGSTA